MELLLLILRILGTILLCLLVISLIPVGASLRYSPQGIAFFLHISKFKISLYPPKVKKVKKVKKAKKQKKVKKPKPAKGTSVQKKKKTHSDSNKPQKKESSPPPKDASSNGKTSSPAQKSPQDSPKQQNTSASKSPLSLEMSLWEKVAFAKSFLPLVLDALGKLGRYKKINHLELDLLVGAEDPVEATLLYGQAHALLGGIWLPLDHSLNIQKGKASVRLDYEQNIIAFSAYLELTILIGQILYLALYLWREGKKVLHSHETTVL